MNKSRRAFFTSLAISVITAPLLKVIDLFDPTPDPLVKIQWIELNTKAAEYHEDLHRIWDEALKKRHLDRPELWNIGHDLL